MRRVFQCLFTVACALTLLGSVSAQQCNNRYLQSIYEKLPANIKESGRGEISGFALKMDVNSDGVIAELGVDIPILNYDSTFISSFAERYFLDLLLAKSNLDIKNVLDHSKSKLYYNDNEYQKGPYWKLAEGLSLLSRSISFDTRRDSLNYQLVWRDDKNRSLTLEFPANVQIITGYDKEELESTLEAQFSEATFTEELKADVVDVSKYVKVKDRIYALPGTSFILDSLSSTTYYTRKKGDKFEAVYTPDMLALSLTNLLLSPMKQGDKTMVRVEQRMYGNKIKNFEVSTNALRAFCQEYQFDTYIGIESSTDKKVEATVLLHNKELNYIHMFHVMTDVNSLFGARAKFMSARLFSYIPFDNVANLFEEYSEPTEKIKIK